MLESGNDFLSDSSCFGTGRLTIKDAGVCFSHFSVFKAKYLFHGIHNPSNYKNMNRNFAFETRIYIYFQVLFILDTFWNILMILSNNNCFLWGWDGVCFDLDLQHKMKIFGTLHLTHLCGGGRWQSCLNLRLWLYALHDR